MFVLLKDLVVGVGGNAMRGNGILHNGEIIFIRMEETLSRPSTGIN